MGGDLLYPRCGGVYDLRVCPRCGATARDNCRDDAAHEAQRMARMTPEERAQVIADKAVREAAPVLLEALEGLLALTDHLDEAALRRKDMFGFLFGASADTILIARAAIAKAKGDA